MFRGHGVGTQECHLVDGLGENACHPHLRVDVQTVAGLALHRRRALPEHLVHHGGDHGVQIRVAGSPGGRHGAPDPATVVLLTVHAGVELVGPVPGEHRVGVGVDEPRDEGLPAQIDGVIGSRSMIGRPHPGDSTLLDDDRCAVQLTQRVGVV